MPFIAKWLQNHCKSLANFAFSTSALYFKPIERSAFNPYQDYHFRSGAHGDNIEVQRRLETWGRIVLLVLGLVCVAL
jgi:hypothetical protein